MKAYFVYSPFNTKELELLERVVHEFGEYAVELVDYTQSRDRFHITQTPALIIIREDLQGQHLLDEGVDGKLRVHGEVLKAIEEEEKNIHNVDHSRIDYFVKQEVANEVDSTVFDIVMRGGI